MQFLQILPNTSERRSKAPEQASRRYEKNARICNLLILSGFELKKWWTIFLFSRKILSTSKWRIFRVSKGGAFSLLEKFSGRNWNFILPQKRV